MGHASWKLLLESLIGSLRPGGHLIALQWRGKYHDRMKSTIDGAGRIVIPKSVCDQRNARAAEQIQPPRRIRLRVHD
jgi:hypothetical protein